MAVRTQSSSHKCSNSSPVVLLATSASTICSDLTTVEIVFVNVMVIELSLHGSRSLPEAKMRPFLSQEDFRPEDTVSI
jgi:hypothetical protein